MADLFLTNDHALTLTGLEDSLDNTFINDATVVVTVFDLSGVAVVGPTWPLTMVYITGSNGNYRVTLPSTMTLSAGLPYLATCTITSGASIGTLSKDFTASVRKST